MKKNTFLLLLISLISMFLLLDNTVRAQVNPEEQVKKYNVTFPVAELENCTSFSACHTYCEDATHSAACIAFAKKKGFYKEKVVDAKKQELIQAAKTELGCDSEITCRATCEQEANFDKCQTFARKNGLDKGREDQKGPADKAVLQKAKTILGCDSPTTCKAICEQETNREKCSEFAKQAGLEGGIHRAGPGGCNTETSCRSYCEKNPGECKKFAGQNDQRDDGENQNKGPGGCDSEASCRKYCTEHPNECRRPSDDSGDEFSEQQDSSKIRCEKNPAECQKFPESKERNPSNMPDLNISRPPPPNQFINTGPSGGVPPRELRQQSEEQFREQRKRMEEQFREQKKDGEEQQREQRKQMEEQRREERKDFQEKQREQTKQTNEFRSREDKPSEIKGVSTVSSLFQRFVNFFLGK